MAEHSLSAVPTHSRWNAALPSRLTIDSGDVVHFECQDSSGAQVHPGMIAEEFQGIDRGRIHALTGPVAIEGAEPGDVLQIDVLDVRHKGWGWSSVIPGLGFLKQRFTEPFLFHWELEPLVSRSLAPAWCRCDHFAGSWGLRLPNRVSFARGHRGCSAAIWMCASLRPAQRYTCPCFSRARCSPVEMRTRHKAMARSASTGSSALPMFLFAFGCTSNNRLRARWSNRRPAPDEHGASWVVVESSTDALAAAHGATDRMVDLLSSRWGFDPVHAYLLCSVAMHLQRESGCE